MPRERQARENRRAGADRRERGTTLLTVEIREADGDRSLMTLRDHQSP